MDNPPVKAPASSSDNMLAGKIMFPYHVFKNHPNLDFYQRYFTSKSKSNNCFFSTQCSFVRSFFFKSVLAAENGEVANSNVSSSSDIEDIKQKEYSKKIHTLAINYIQQETGWERVKSFFEKDHKGNQNEEYSFIKKAFVQIWLSSFMLKYFLSYKLVKEDFIRENQATVFRTKMEYNKVALDNIMYSCIKKSAPFAFKVGFFSTSFMFLAIIISRYRNKTSVLEYTAAFGITSSIYKLDMGLRQSMAAFLIGGTLGTITGAVIYSLLKMNGETTEERYLTEIIEKMECRRMIEGENLFDQRIAKILAGDSSISTLFADLETL